MNYGKTKPGELNEEEFVKFWADLYALFDKIDKDGGLFLLSLDIYFKYEKLIKKILKTGRSTTD